MSRRARIGRALRRAASRQVLRAIALGLSEPSNDPFWRFVVRRDTARYLEQPEPWLAPGAVDYLTRHVGSETEVFEWGAGASTLWFAARGCRVTSYETEIEWARRVRELSGSRVSVRVISADDLEYVCPKLDKYDVVVVDGKERPACIQHVLGDAGRVSQLVVLDDSHRRAYRASVAALGNAARQQWHFPGLSAMLTPKLTSVFLLDSAGSFSPTPLPRQLDEA